MKIRATILLLFFISASLFSNVTVAEDAWPGEPFDNHIHLTWATLTIEVNQWADDHPEIVDLTSVGESELGKNLWVVRLSDWSMETKADGSPKEIVYIDGGHHGNEYLGTALAWLSAKWYLNGWIEGNEEAIRVLQNSEVHILIMLNPDGNDIDTRWNINQVDLNRNYDHYWNTCPTTQPGSSAFSESETLANSIYMNTVVPDADLYVTMHTGVWIMLYPWGKWPEQPSDWEMFHSIRDDVHANISDIPIQNANQGLYPNCGTSRDYGYGVMGFPTFTFETDDEQFVPVSFESLHDRLEEELDVMRYLIDNVWYWRARLNVTSMEVDAGNKINLEVKNLGQATTTNATLQYVDETGTILWNSSYFSVNATNSSSLIFDASNLTLIDEGFFELYYQKRVIDSSTWVNEPISPEIIQKKDYGSSGINSGTILLLQLSSLPFFGLVGLWLWNRMRKLSEEHGFEDGSDLPIIKTLCVAVSGIWVCSYSIAAMMSYHSRIMGATESLVILHVGLMVLSLSIGAIFAGALADRIGKRNQILLMALGLNIILTVTLPLLSLYPFILITTIQAFLFGSFKLIFAIVTEIYPNSQGEAISLTWAFAYLCSGISSLLMGSLYNWGGLIGCLIVSIILLIISIIFIQKLKHIDSGNKTNKKPTNIKKNLNLSEMLKFKSSWIILILGAVLALSIPRGAVIHPSLRYLEIIGFNIEMTSIFFGWADLAGIILLIYVGRLVDQFGPSTTLFWAAIGYGVLWSLFAIGMPPLVSAIIFIIPIYPFLIVSSDSLMAKYSTLDERNRAIGLSTTITLMGQAIGIGLSVSILWMLEKTKLSIIDKYLWAFRASIPLFIIAIILCWRLYDKIGIRKILYEKSENRKTIPV